LKRIPSGARFNIFLATGNGEGGQAVDNGNTVCCTASQHQTAVKGIALDR
jgi:hypothetical protein|tara:strand:- start:4895 stop:5044 length:150 start_codon:yes stop_codon:yes gene_type:complete